ncbi:MAG: hypothetical protein AAB348_03635, partial [Patescibacteria group bacterium]
MKRKKIFRLNPTFIRRRMKRFFALENLFNRQHRHFHALLAVVLIAVILVNVFQPRPEQTAQGATFTFTQTAWNTASTTASATHTSDQNNWANYVTSTNLVVGNSLTLATSSALTVSAATNIVSSMFYNGISMVKDSNGIFYISYLTESASTTRREVFFRTSTDGVAWSTPVAVSESVGSYDVSASRLVVDSSNVVHMVFSKWGTIFYASSTNNFAQPQSLGAYTWDGSIALDSSGKVHITANISNSSIIHKSNSDNWATTQTITAETGYPQDSTIFITSGTIYVVYNSRALLWPANAHTIALRTSTESGATWSGRVDVTTSTPQSSGSSIVKSMVVDNSGVVHVVYISDESGSTFAYRNSNNWGNKVAISATTIYRPQLAINSADILYVVYYSYVSPYTTGFNFSTDSGSTWSSRTDVMTVGNGSNTPLIMTDASSTIYITSVHSSYPGYYNTVALPTYISSGTLTSTPFNSESSANVIGQVNWDEDATLPTNTTVTVSARTASTSALLSSASWTDFTNATSGCTKSSGAVTCTSDAIPSAMEDGANDQWFQYKVTLGSSGNRYRTPTVSEVRIKYVVNAPPEAQSVSSTPNTDGTVTISYQVRDSDTDTGTTNPNSVSTTFQYCANATTTGCVSITAFPAGTGIANAVATSTWTTHTATWTPATDLGTATYDANAVIKITLNDNELVNNTASATSSVFILDTGPPSGTATTSVTIDASVSPAIVTVSTTDNSS